MVSGGGQEIARFYAVLGADTSAFNAGVAQAQSTWSRFGQSMLQGVGIGAGFAAVTTAVRALSSGIQASVGNVIAYETAFTGIRKTVDGTAEDFAQLDKNIRGMATTLPVGRVELANIGQAAGQLGVRGVENITKFTETIAKISRATNLTSEAAATGFARFANVMGTPISQVDILASGVVALGNNMATTESEILEFGSRISGAGKIAGLTEGQVFSLGAALASIGVEAEAGGSAASMALLAFNEVVAKGGDELELLAAVSGMTSQQFVKAWKDDAFGAFVAFEKGLGQSGDQASIVLDNLGLGGIRTGRALLGLAQNTDLLTNALGHYEEGAEDANALNEEFAKFADTTANKIAVMKNNVTELGDEVGGPLVSALLVATDQMLQFVESTQRGIDRTKEFFNTLNEQTNGASGGIGSRIADAVKLGWNTSIPATLWREWTGPEASGVAQFGGTPAGEMYGDSVGGASDAWVPGRTGSGVAKYATPWFEGYGDSPSAGLMNAGAGNFEANIKKLNGAFDDGATKASAAEKAEASLARARENATQHVEDVMTTRLVEAFITGGDAAVAAVRSENDALLAEFNGMLPQFKALGLEIPETALDMFINIKDGAKKAAAEVARAFDQLRYGLVNNPSDSVQADFEAGAATGQVLARDSKGNQSWFPRGAVPAGYNVLADPSALGYTGNPGGATLLGPASGAVTDQFGGIPQLAGGMSRVPYDGYLAMLHKGEGVVTAAANLNGGGGGGGINVTVVMGASTVISEGDFLRKVQRAVREGIEGGGYRDLIMSPGG